MDDGSTASVCWDEAQEPGLDVPRRRTALCRGNEALGRPLAPLEEKAMIAAAAAKIGELLDVLRIDHRHDHNTRDTPTRVAKMLVRELLRGRFSAPPAITDFDNAEGFDQLIVTGPIAVRSTCAHHLLPIYGEAFVGVLPDADGRIIGLSKYDRIVEHFAARFQIQEELAKQIAGFIDTVTRPRGVAVRISAVHMCKTQRGVRAPHASRMVSTVCLGEMLLNPDLKNEFLQECHALGRSGG
jgi:GTP cyclohydrolase IA